MTPEERTAGILERYDAKIIRCKCDPLRDCSCMPQRLLAPRGYRERLRWTAYLRETLWPAPLPYAAVAGYREPVPTEPDPPMTRRHLGVAEEEVITSDATARGWTPSAWVATREAAARLGRCKVSRIRFLKPHDFDDVIQDALLWSVEHRVYDGERTHVLTWRKAEEKVTKQRIHYREQVRSHIKYGKASEQARWAHGPTIETVLAAHFDGPEKSSSSVRILPKAA